jgi:hypothetical protein
MSYICDNYWVNMKWNIFFGVIITAFLFWSCSEKKKELSPEEINRKADSMVQAKRLKLEQQAAEDLKMRMPIEIKPKLDSIRNKSFVPSSVPIFPEEGNTVSAPIDSVVDSSK